MKPLDWLLFAWIIWEVLTSVIAIIGVITIRRATLTKDFSYGLVRMAIAAGLLLYRLYG